MIIYVPETFIERVKRSAKIQQRADGPDGARLSKYHDRIAILSGFRNWSLLHKALNNTDNFKEMYSLCTRVSQRIPDAFPDAAVEYMIADITSFLDSNYERLDNDSNNHRLHNVINVRAIVADEPTFRRIFTVAMIESALERVEDKCRWSDEDIMIDEFYLPE